MTGYGLEIKPMLLVLGARYDASVGTRLSLDMG